MAKGRLIAIGDVHGEYNKMLDLLEKLEVSGRDRIVFLGDLVDYGPQSADVIEYLVGFRKYYQADFVMGNHDLWFLYYLRHGYADPQWLKYGGYETLLSYNGQKIPDSHYRFLMHLYPKPIIYEEVVRTYYFSHGMLCPTKPIRNRFYKSDALFGRPSSFGLKVGDKPKMRWDKNEFLVCGHTPHAQPQFYGEQVLVIDTDVKNGGPITAAICPMAGHVWEFVQS